MKLGIKLSKFRKTLPFYEYMHNVVSKHIDHNVDGLLINKLRKEQEDGYPTRYYRSSLLTVYRILTARNFEMGLPLIQAYNPSIKLKNGKLLMLIRLGTFEPSRTFLGITEIDSFGNEFLSPEMRIPNKSYPTRIFIRARLPYESLEDPRFSPINDEFFFVTVLRGPGFPVAEPVISWIIKDEEVAPIMYRDTVLSDNRDSFRVTEKVMTIRPNYKYAPRNVLALGYIDKDNPNVVEDAFTYTVFRPRKEEEKTGGGTTVKIGNNKYLFVYHVVYRGIGGLKGEGTAGIYINYGVILDEDGNLLAEIQDPLTPIDYPYSGQRPGVIFVTGGLVLDKNDVYRFMPDVNNYLKDFDKLLMLVAGVDDESTIVLIQDLDKVLENAKWY